MIGSTNAKSTYPSYWNLEKASYIAGEDIKKNDPVLISSKMSNMKAITTIPNAIDVAKSSRSLSCSRDGRFIVNLLSASPFYAIYERDASGVYNRMTGIPEIWGETRSAEFTSDNYLYLGLASTPFIYTYKIEDNNFVEISPSSLGIDMPNNGINMLRSSASSNLFAIADSLGVRVYKRDNTTSPFRRIGTTNISVTPSSIEFNEKYNIVGIGSTSGSPYLRLYRITDDSLVQLTIPGNAPNGVNSIAFLEDHIIVCSATIHYIYKINSDYSISLVSSTSQSNTFSMTITPDSRYVVANMQADIVVYKIEYPATLVRYNYSPNITGSNSQILFTPQGEMILARIGMIPPSYKLENKIYRMSSDRSYVGAIEGYGYAQETKDMNFYTKILKFEDFSIL